MNVLHILDHFSVGGLEKVVRDLVLNSRPPVKPHVCTLRGGGRFSADVAAAGLPVVHLGSVREPRSGRELLSRICRIVRTEDIDILHCHDLKSWALGVPAALATRRKLIVTRHGHFDFKTASQLLMAQSLALLTDCIVAVSADISNQLAAKHIGRKSRVQTIHNGISLPQPSAVSAAEARSRIDISPDAFVIGTVTRFFPVKNLEMQVELVSRLRGQITGLKYVVAAPTAGSHYQSILRMIVDKGLNDHVLLLGCREDIPDVLSTFDLFLLTSTMEGTSIALLEAMASGLPVIVSNVGGNPLVVTNEVDGLLFDVNSLDSLADAVLRIYQDPCLRRRLAQNAGDTARRYGLSTMVEQYYRAYCRVLQIDGN